jgi:ribonuclease HI
VDWTIYSPSHTLLHSSGVCLGPTTNNQAKYVVMINLLADVTHLYIHHFSVFLDSHLIFMQLKNVYHVHDPFLFRKYMQVKLLSRNFESITFTHIPRSENQIVDHIANEILDLAFVALIKHFFIMSYLSINMYMFCHHHIMNMYNKSKYKHISISSEIQTSHHLSYTMMRQNEYVCVNSYQKWSTSIQMGWPSLWSYLHIIYKMRAFPLYCHIKKNVGLTHIHRNIQKVGSDHTSQSSTPKVAQALGPPQTEAPYQSKSPHQPNASSIREQVHLPLQPVAPTRTNKN